MDAAQVDALLRQARLGDPHALGQLVEAYSSRVYGLLYRLTRSRDAADDLLQETFLRVVRGLGEYEHVGKFESWLFRIAANLARDRGRMRGRRGETVALDDVPPLQACRNTPDSGTQPSRRLSEREAGERLEQALGRLSDADREIIVLRHYSELPFKEIAEMLGIPLGTALARAHRALAKLREELADEE